MHQWRKRWRSRHKAPELVQARATVEIATGIPPRIVHRPSGTHEVARRIVLIYGYQCPSAIGQADHRAAHIEEVIVRPRWGAFVNQRALATTTARIVRRARAIGLAADAIPTVDQVRTIDLHPLGLVCSTVTEGIA